MIDLTTDDGGLFSAVIGGLCAIANPEVENGPICLEWFQIADLNTSPEP